MTNGAGTAQAAGRAAEVDLDLAAGLITGRGAWTLPHLAALERRLAGAERSACATITWDLSGLRAMDTAGAWLVQRTVERLQAAGKHVALRGLSAEHAALLAMVAGGGIAPAVAQSVSGHRARDLEWLGRRVWAGVAGGRRFLAFIGESSIASAQLLLRPQHIRLRAVLHNVQATGVQALPIVGLLSFLIGVVIGYQSAVQLRQYGANIYIADLVGLSMLRELAGLMTAVIVAGRSGSAFTAQIGTMQVTEEIDALRTMGITPMELLVVPKVWALMLALPLLTVFSDVLGVMGGMLMAELQLGVSAPTFLDRFDYATTLPDFLVGVSKAPVFAVIIALVGCYQGFRVHGGADSVGQQTTMSVVQSIFLVIVADALFSIAFSWFGI